MTPVFVDPRLLGAIQEAVGFPNVPYDLKKVKALTNFLPATGISLPFFSYGGTALLLQLFEMGLILSVSRQSNNKLL